MAVEVTHRATAVPPGPVSLQEVLRAVHLVTGVEPCELLEPVRSARVVRARRLVAAAARRWTHASFPEISRVISAGKGHSTALTAARDFERYRDCLDARGRSLDDAMGMVGTDLAVRFAEAAHRAARKRRSA